jgi:hypothetical protein
MHGVERLEQHLCNTSFFAHVEPLLMSVIVLGFANIDQSPINEYEYNLGILKNAY